jgi:hypothetical protein
MTSSIKTRTVRFTYGTAKDAALEIPAEPTNLITIAKLIHQSFLRHMFSRSALMADEVLVSSIGRDNFEAGALLGWKERLDEKSFGLLESQVKSDVAMALAVVRYRNPSISNRDAYLVAAKNEALNDDTRKFLRAAADLDVAVAS